MCDHKIPELTDACIRFNNHDIKLKHLLSLGAKYSRNGATSIKAQVIGSYFNEFKKHLIQMLGDKYNEYKVPEIISDGTLLDGYMVYFRKNPLVAAQILNFANEIADKIDDIIHNPEKLKQFEDRQRANEITAFIRSTKLTSECKMVELFAAAA